MNELVENEDYYLDNGLMVFTAKYLEARETCCGNDCRNCPYNFINVTEPARSRLLIQDSSLGE
jgi:hypothetical protein